MKAWGKYKWGWINRSIGRIQMADGYGKVTRAFLPELL
jgi:hypothetical protein